MLTDPKGIGRVTEPCEVEADLASLLKSLGFDAGIPVYRVTPSLTFAELLNDIQKQLFERGSDSPQLLTFKRRDRRLNAWTLYVAIELLRPIYKPFRLTADGPVPTSAEPGPFSRRAWYFRGFVCDDHPIMRPRVIGRINAYIPTDDLSVAHGWPDGMVIQIVTEPSSADPDTPFMWGVGLPGELSGV
jgi:hypothetical protein